MFLDTPNRTLCQVLDDMRKYIKHTYLTETDKHVLLKLVQEVQIMGNRMEAGLWDQNDIKDLRQERKDLKKEIDKLEKQKGEINE